MEKCWLSMIQLSHQLELRKFSEVEIPDAEIEKEKLDFAIASIEQVVLIRFSRKSTPTI